jgi:hypothetical protein
MSDLRIALIAEGPTDAIIIESALKAILPKSFVMYPLQPEPTRPDLGSGWGGVLKWCREVSGRGAELLEDDPTLERFDLIILHIDADVADKSYADYGRELEEAAQQGGWGFLPCSLPCPPPEASINKLRTVLLSWLGIDSIGDKTVLCIPSKSTEAWLAAAVFPGNLNLMQDIECAMRMENRLAQLPKAQRIKKNIREYRSHSVMVKAGWARVRLLCSRADIFHRTVEAIAIGR